MPYYIPPESENARGMMFIDRVLFGPVDPAVRTRLEGYQLFVKDHGFKPMVPGVEFEEQIETKGVRAS